MGREKQVCNFTIFGVLDDVSRRELLPFLYPFDQAGLQHEEILLMGVAHHGISRDEFIFVFSSFSCFFSLPVQASSFFLFFRPCRSVLQKMAENRLSGFGC